MFDLLPILANKPLMILVPFSFVGIAMFGYMLLLKRNMHRPLNADKAEISIPELLCRKKKLRK